MIKRNLSLRKRIDQMIDLANAQLSSFKLVQRLPMQRKHMEPMKRFSSHTSLVTYAISLMQIHLADHNVLIQIIFNQWIN